MADLDNNTGLKDAKNIQEAQVVSKDLPIEDDDSYKGKIKVINNITGEILEREYKSIHEAKNLYQEIAASESAFKRAKDKVKITIERFMGSYDEYEFADGDRAYWSSPSRKSISYGHVAAALGEEVANLLSDINVGKLEEYLQEAIKHGEISRDDQDKLLANVTIGHGKAFIKVGKAKR